MEGQLRADAGCTGSQGPPTHTVDAPSTFLVQPVEEQPTMARLVTLPLNADWTELMKLDFPEPIGPRKRTRA